MHTAPQIAARVEPQPQRHTAGTEAHAAIGLSVIGVALALSCWLSLTPIGSSDSDSSGATWSSTTQFFTKPSQTPSLTVRRTALVGSSEPSSAARDSSTPTAPAPTSFQGFFQGPNDGEILCCSTLEVDAAVLWPNETILWLTQGKTTVASVPVPASMFLPREVSLRAPVASNALVTDVRVTLRDRMSGAVLSEASLQVLAPARPLDQTTPVAQD